jgi:hypothetical protein
MGTIKKRGLAFIVLAVALSGCERQGNSAKSAMLADSDTGSAGREVVTGNAAQARPQPAEPAPAGGSQAAMIEDSVRRPQKATQPPNRPVPQPQEPKP